MTKFPFEDMDWSQLAAGSRTQEKREKPVPKPTSDFGAVMGALGSLGSSAIEGYVNTKRAGQARTIDAISRAATMANMGIAIPETMKDLPSEYVKPMRDVAALRQEKDKAEIERLRNPQGTVKQAEEYYAEDPESKKTGYSYYLITYGKDGVPKVNKTLDVDESVAKRSIELTERKSSGPIGKTSEERAFDAELAALRLSAAGYSQDKRTGKWLSYPQKAKPEWQALYNDMIARHGRNPSRRLQIEASKLSGVMAFPTSTMTDEQLERLARGEGN